MGLSMISNRRSSLESSWYKSCWQTCTAPTERESLLHFRLASGSFHWPHRADWSPDLPHPSPFNPPSHLLHRRKIYIFKSPAKLTNYLQKYIIGREVKFKMFIFYCCYFANRASCDCSWRNLLREIKPSLRDRRLKGEGKGRDERVMREKIGRTREDRGTFSLPGSF